MQISRYFGVLSALVVIITACAPTAPGNRDGTGQASARGPRNIVAAITGQMPALEYRFIVSSNNAGYPETARLFRGELTTFDDSGERVPQLAASVPSLENGGWKLNSDQTMETRFALKPGVLWHDGTPVTSQDMLFDDEVYRNRELPQTIVSARTFISRVEAVDERTVAVHWREPYILADRYAPGLLPVHILEESYRQSASSITNHAWLTQEYVGTGPFKLKHFEPGAWMDLVAFDQYVLGRPKLDEIQVRFIPDTNTLIANLLSGGIDLTMGRGPSVAQGKQLKDQGWDGLVDITPNNWLHMFAQYIDPVHPVITEKRFHKALMYGQNRQSYVDEIQFGFGGVGHIWLAPNDSEYDRNLRRAEQLGVLYPYDPRKALQLLEEIGLIKGSDGALRLASSGERLPALEFRTTQDVQLSIQVLAVQAADLRQLGMEINEVVIPASRTADRVYRTTGPALEQLRGGMGPGALIGLMHSSKLPTPANNYTSGNYPRYANPEWDGLIDRFATTIPINERNQLMSDILMWLADNLMQMPVIYDASTVMAARRLVGATAHHGGQDQNQGWDAHLWDLR